MNGGWNAHKKKEGIIHCMCIASQPKKSLVLHTQNAIAPATRTGLGFLVHYAIPALGVIGLGWMRAHVSFSLQVDSGNGICDTFDEIFIHTVR